MLQQVLENIGLSPKEAKVYLALMDKGPSTAFEISKKTNINHSTVYLELNRLKDKGLINQQERNNKQIFITESPLALDRLISNQEQMITDIKTLLRNNFAELNSIFLTGQNTPKIKYYEGKEGFEAIQRDADLIDAASVKQHCAFTPLDIYDDLKISDRVAQDRIKRGQFLRSIYTHKDGIQNISNPAQLRESRYLPRDKYPFDANIVIAPNHSIRLFSLKRGFIGFWIFNPDIANLMKMLFDGFWEIAEKK